MSKSESNIAKGIAIIFMYLHHLFGDIDKWTDNQIQSWFLDESLAVSVCVTLKICVSIFVFITAYGISRSMSDKVDKGKSNINQYVNSRLIKLYSGFWFIYIVARITGFMGRSATDIYGEFGLERISYVIIDFFGLARFFDTPTFCSTWWYMSLAIVIIILIPVLRVVYKKFGGIILILSVLMLPSILGWNGENKVRIYYYLLTCVLGIIAAESNWFEKLRSVVKDRKICSAVLNVVTVAMLGFTILVRIKIGADSFTITYALGALIICTLSFFCINKIVIVNSILEKIGEHSMNLFLIHTFFYSYYFKEYIYMWKYPVLILIVLLIVTMLASIVIEFIKKITCYNKLFDLIDKKMSNLLK